MQVGVRFYQTKIYKDHKSYSNNAGVSERDMHAIIQNFIGKYTKKPFVKTASSDDGSEGEKRSHRFLPEKDDAHSIHGLIRYGSFGYATEVENVNTGIVEHKRTLNEADTIPLYYRFWWPPSYSYGLWAFQSYSGRSCASAVLGEFRSHYRENYVGWKFESKKVVPSEITQYANARVKRLTLVKRKANSGTVSSALKPVLPGSEVDIEFEVKARGQGYFGKLSDMKNKLAGQMLVGDIDYGTAYATVMVDGKPKKIGVVGVSTNTGVIDITSDVAFDAASKMPTLDSVSKAVKSEMQDFAKKLGN